MKAKDLDLWFNRIDGNGLMKIFGCPTQRTMNDFIDDCDEYWAGLSRKKKQELYDRFSTLV